MEPINHALADVLRTVRMPGVRWWCAIASARRGSSCAAQTPERSPGPPSTPTACTRCCPAPRGAGSYWSTTRCERARDVFLGHRRTSERPPRLASCCAAGAMNRLRRCVVQHGARCRGLDPPGPPRSRLQLRAQGQPPGARVQQEPGNLRQAGQATACKRIKAGSLPAVDRSAAHRFGQSAYRASAVRRLVQARWRRSTGHWSGSVGLCAAGSSRQARSCRLSAP